MNKVRTYLAPSVDFARLAEALESWFLSQSFHCQVLTTEDGGLLLQVEKQGGWRKFIGMSTALNVMLRRREQQLEVEIGAGRWLDKGVAAGVSLVVLWPLAVTAAMGAWDQAKMPQRVFDFVAQYVSDVEASALRPALEAAPPLPLPAAPETLYYLGVAGQTAGPMPRSQVLLGLQQGSVPRSALVCPVGGQAWQSIAEHPDFAAGAPPPPPPPPLPPSGGVR
jgi:hypothetical protein